MTQQAHASSRRRLGLWGGVTGFGLGAVIDVVLFHLILQEHHLLSGSIDPTTFEGFRDNITIDGLFLLLMLGVMALGLVGLWRTVNGTVLTFSGLSLTGFVVLGAGVFNVLDGVLSHYVLGLHDVVHQTAAWNPHWLGVSLFLLALGGFLIWVADGVLASSAEAPK